MRTKRRETGDLGESIAALYLERKGFKIVSRNYRKPWGEIDIIAEKDGQVRFVEVKSVSCEMLPAKDQDLAYRPEELVDRRKLIKLARTAALYMEKNRDAREYQLDVVGVLLEKANRRARCRLFEQALEGNL